MTRASRRYGWKRSPQDVRDRVAEPPTTVLPEVDLRLTGAMPAVYDQMALGSCTANAVCAALQYDGSLDNIAAGKPRWHRRSRLDLYYGERKLEGTLGEDDPGAYGRDGFKYAQQTGVLLEERWPYDIATYQGPPPSGYKRHRLLKPYASVPQDADHIKAALSNRQPVAFGFDVYSEFEDTTGTTGFVTMPRATEQYLGGHEVLAVGYLVEHPHHVLCRNSWGVSWSPFSGYFFMPWSYITDSSLAGDLRTIVRSAA